MPKTNGDLGAAPLSVNDTSVGMADCQPPFSDKTLATKRKVLRFLGHQAWKLTMRLPIIEDILSSLPAMTALIRSASGLARTLSIPHIQERTFQFSPLKIFPATQIPCPSTQVPQARTRKNTCGQKPNWDGNTDQHRHVVAKRSVKHPIQKRTRVFLLETQNGIVQDELALWRIAAVVSKKNLRLTTCPKSTLRHSSGVATCWGLLTSGLIMLRWHLRSSSWGSALGWELQFFCLHTCVQHILPHFFWARWKAKTTAAVVFVFHLVQGALTGGGLELGQRRRHSRRILPDFFRSFGEPSLPKPFLVDIWVLLQEVRAHWLVLFGYLLQFLQVLVELGKAWLGPKQPRVLPHVRTTDIAFLGVDVKLGDQSDLPGAQHRGTHVFWLQPFDLFILGQERPGGAAPAIHISDHNNLKSPPPPHDIVSAGLLMKALHNGDHGSSCYILLMFFRVSFTISSHSSWQTWRSNFWCSVETGNSPVTKGSKWPIPLVPLCFESALASRKRSLLWGVPKSSKVPVQS